MDDLPLKLSRRGIPPRTGSKGGNYGVSHRLIVHAAYPHEYSYIRVFGKGFKGMELGIRGIQGPRRIM